MISEKLNTADRIRNIVLPDRSVNLAEFMGILTGDGFMNYYEKRKAYLIEISGNKLKDRHYLEEFVSHIVAYLFNMKPAFYSIKNQNTICLIIRSKRILNFLKEQGFPLGRKREITPPSWIIENNLFFKKFIRGFFDTDGYLCLKNKEGKKYPVIGLSSKSEPLLIKIQQFLRELNIGSYLGNYKSNNNLRYKKEWVVYKLQISGRKNVHLFFDKIGSCNLRNQIKYKEMGVGGIEPPAPRDLSLDKYH